MINNYFDFFNKNDNKFLKIIVKDFDTISFKISSLLELNKNEIHIWLIYIDLYKSNTLFFENLLCNDEVNKMNSFYFEKDKERFAITHGLLRILISKYLNLSNNKIKFEKDLYGKPKVVIDDKNINFNISHSNNLIAFAFSNSATIGIDVEYNKNINDFNDIVTNYFHELEIENFNKVSNLKKQDIFYRYWTQKEAFLKATGEGLNRSLSSFYIQNKFDNYYKVNDENYSGYIWNIISFNILDNYTASICFKHDKLGK
ncbi:4'-phosphopantetheinyl transferase superfamily protein [Clostridium sp. ATCC 25772]|uniref:4'-phosphopantetheinyl transferase family protein n=1 Tax=Clostridium sp. ATCC 25772 TaxID=1676991 RepID=UPI0007838938|nr:4'-phosphopantetheinyl transferase superfamily protein [Clostridium sp. ATCC 25772]